MRERFGAFGKENMKTFTDNAGRHWNLALDIYTVKKVRDVLHVDLLDLGADRDKPGEGVLNRLIVDPVLLVDVVFVVCQDQAEKLDVTDEQFGRAMAGDAIDAATKALLEEIADFIPSPRDRARARKVIAAIWKMIDRAQDLLDAKAEKDLPAAAAALLKTLGESSTSSPASSESTPES